MQGVRIACVGVSVSVTALVSVMSPLKVRARYQQKALDAGNKINVRIELKIHSSKVMTVIRNLHLVLMAGNRHQQVTCDVRILLLHHTLHLLLHIYAWGILQDLHFDMHSQCTRYKAGSVSCSS